MAKGGNKSETEVTAKSNVAVAEKEKERKQLAVSLKKQEKVPIQISPLYQPYFGKVHTVTINGISVAIPCDGKTYMVPKTFAEEAKIRIFKQDQLIQKKNRLGDVSNNFENSPGELNLF
jgi:hypothetical protein